MPGATLTYKTLGDGKDYPFSVIFYQNDPTPSFAISVRADPNNTGGKFFKAGRNGAVEPFYADDDRTYYSCRMEELLLNDQGTSGLILYVDNSGPMDPQAQYVTVVRALDWVGKKAPNDPTP